MLTVALVLLALGLASAAAAETPADERWAYALAHEMADGTSHTSVSITRGLLWNMLGAPHPMDAHRADSAVIEWCFASPDFREGAISFLQKRPAAFPNRVPADLPDFLPLWPEPDF